MRIEIVFCTYIVIGVHIAIVVSIVRGHHSILTKLKEIKGIKIFGKSLDKSIDKQYVVVP